MHPFDPISRASLLTLTGLPLTSLDKRVREGQVCFLSSLKGLDAVAGKGRRQTVAVDAVAIELASRFTADGLRWDLVADALPAFWPELLRYDAEGLQLRRDVMTLSALDRAERSRELVLFMIAEYEGGLAGVTMGTMQALADQIMGQGDRSAMFLRFTAVNMQQAIAAVRSRAEAAGIELPQYFAPPVTRAEIEALPRHKRPAFMQRGAS